MQKQCSVFSEKCKKMQSASIHFTTVYDKCCTCGTYSPIKVQKKIRISAEKVHRKCTKSAAVQQKCKNSALHFFPLDPQNGVLCRTHRVCSATLSGNQRMVLTSLAEAGRATVKCCPPHWEMSSTQYVHTGSYYWDEPQ